MHFSGDTPNDEVICTHTTKTLGTPCAIDKTGRMMIPLVHTLLVIFYTHSILEIAYKRVDYFFHQHPHYSRMRCLQFSPPQIGQWLSYRLWACFSALGPLD